MKRMSDLTNVPQCFQKRRWEGELDGVLYLAKTLGTSLGDGARLTNGETFRQELEENVEIP